MKTLRIIVLVSIILLAGVSTTHAYYMYAPMMFQAPIINNNWQPTFLQTQSYYTRAMTAPYGMGYYGGYDGYNGYGGYGGYTNYGGYGGGGYMGMGGGYFGMNVGFNNASVSVQTPYGGGAVSFPIPGRCVSVSCPGNYYQGYQGW